MTPFTIPQDRVDFWKMQCGYKVICGPAVNVVVARNTPASAAKPTGLLPLFLLALANLNKTGAAA